MPTDVWFWVAVAAVVAAVVALAIWKNRGINFELGRKGVKVATQVSPPSGITKVAERIKLDENAKVGSIIGNERRSDASPINQSTEVAKQAVVGKGAEVGDIIGNKIVGTKEPGR
jgi:hypothetical protein